MAKPSKQAERFWRAERARKVARSTPLGTIIEVRKAPPFVRLMKPGERCCVDDAIREALATGLLRGTLDEVRADLVVVCALAWGAAAWAYGARIAEPDIRKQKARVARLADDLAAVVDAMEAERVALEDLAADLGEAEDVTELSAIVEHGRALIPLLKRYATR